MENEFESFYPPKPFLEKEKQRSGHISVTIFSILLFALSFILFFDTQLVLLTEIIAVVLFHELGHLLMMKLFGYKNVRMLFVPLMGAFVHGSKDSYKQRESVLVILAGPVPGILLGIFFWIYGYDHKIAWMIDVSALLFILNSINLAPIQPLDGGRLLNLLFLNKLEFIQIVLTFLTSLFIIGLGWYFSWYILMVFGFMMGFQVRSQHRRYLIHKGLKEEEVPFQSSYESLSDRSYFFIKKHVLEQTPGLRKFIEQAEEEDFSGILASEVRNILVAPIETDLNIVGKLLTILVWMGSIVVPFYLMWSYGLFS